jgi:radical SAM superfamily enzyme YgiQ (UPF0313 family)
MRILLVSANRLRTPYPVFPLGLDHVAGALAGHHEVQVLDLCVPGTEERLESVITDWQPELVGISLRNIDNTDAANSRTFVDDYKQVVTAVRGATRAPIVLGGSGYTICPDEWLDILGADYGMVGEGERLVELAEALAAGTDPAGIAGLVQPGSPVEMTPPWSGEFVRAPDHMIARDHYVQHGGMLNLQTKRGCPYHCVYCTYPAIEGHGLRLFNPADVARDAMRLQETGARFLFIADSTFNCAPEHNLAVAAAMKEAGLEIPWGAFFSPLPVPDGYYHQLVEAGLSHVEFGTETLTETTLKAYGKPFGVQQVREAHRQAQAAGAHVAHYFMPGGPQETPETLQETLVNADSLKQTVHFFFPGIRIYPNTPLYRLALAEGQVSQDQSMLEPVFYQSTELVGIDIEQIIKTHARGRANWIVGAGGARTEKLLTMMYKRGHSGPLWEMLIR